MCEYCEIQEQRIISLHQNSADCMRLNARLKGENEQLRTQVESLRRRPASGLKVGEFSEFYSKLNDCHSRLVEYASEYEVHKRVWEKIEDLTDVLDDWQYRANEGDQ